MWEQEVLEVQEALGEQEVQEVLELWQQGR